jgi:predicted ATPase
MQIKKIKVTNFKSFDELDVTLGGFNVLIGANASGKSNFINIFKCIRDLTDSGLNNAISMQGTEYTRNINIGKSKDLSFELQVDSKDASGVGYELNEKLIGTKAHEFRYKIRLNFYVKKRGVKNIAEETLEMKCDFFKLIKKNGNFEEGAKIKEGIIIIIRDEDGKLKCKQKPRNLPIKEEVILPPFCLTKKISPTMSFIEASAIVLPLSFSLSKFFRGFPIYDLDPKKAKSATSITGKTELEPDGSNFAIVLENILHDSKKAKTFSKLIKKFLPFIEDINVKELPDKSLITKIKEIYNKSEFLPAFSISDGTMNIAALIIALYFNNSPLIIIEEPERNIHPSLLSKVIEMMKDVSENLNKQIIVTTHNPEVVKYAGIENILLVRRDDKGFSQISKPAEKEEVKIFLENNMGIDKLYLQNLLEG